MARAAVDRTFVLGLDGIPWSLLSTWADEGELPNIAHLMDSGASGPLESTMPPTTAVAWPSIATGTRADKHGIYDFRKLESDYRRSVNTSTAIKEPPIWEILGPSVTVNVPMTYPAASIDGTMVTGMMTPERDDGFTHPTAFADELDEAVPDYEIGLPWHAYHGREDEFLSDLEDLVANRRKLMHHLLDTRDWSLFFFVYTAPDRLQHLIWDTDVIREHYRTLDDIVGEVIEHVESIGANLFVVSDHGFGPVEESVHLNHLLADAGYLHRKDDGGTRGVLDRLGLRKDAVQSVLQRAGLEERLLEILPDRVVAGVASQIPGDHGMFDVDFERTEAFAYTGRSVYINDALRFDDGPVGGDARDAKKAEIQSLLETTTHPETGEKLFDVHDGADLFPTDPKAPDLIVEGRGGSEVKSSLASSLVTPASDRSGGHRRTGMFLAWGPDIDATAVEGAQVYDVMPTVLHSQQRPIPRDVDGEVLDIFEAESLPAKEDPTYESYRRGETIETEADDFTDVEDRLQGLGYLE